MVEGLGPGLQIFGLGFRVLKLLVHDFQLPEAWGARDPCRAEVPKSAMLAMDCAATLEVGPGFGGPPLSAGVGPRGLEIDVSSSGCVADAVQGVATSVGCCTTPQHHC